MWFLLFTCANLSYEEDDSCAILSSEYSFEYLKDLEAKLNTFHFDTIGKSYEEICSRDQKKDQVEKMTHISQIITSEIPYNSLIPTKLCQNLSCCSVYIFHGGLEHIVEKDDFENNLIRIPKEYLNVMFPELKERKRTIN
jgi:hypothetical protein